MTSNRVQIEKGDGFHIDCVFLKLKFSFAWSKRISHGYLRKDVTNYFYHRFSVESKCVSFNREKKTESLSVCD